MSAMQAGIVRLLAPEQTWGEMKGYPCLYSHNTMQSTSPRRPQIEHACSRAQSAAQSVDSRLCRELLRPVVSSPELWLSRLLPRASAWHPGAASR